MYLPPVIPPVTPPVTPPEMCIHISGGFIGGVTGGITGGLEFLTETSAYSVLILNTQNLSLPLCTSPSPPVCTYSLSLSLFLSFKPRLHARLHARKVCVDLHSRAQSTHACRFNRECCILLCFVDFGSVIGAQTLHLHDYTGATQGTLCISCTRTHTHTHTRTHVDLTNVVFSRVL